MNRRNFLRNLTTISLSAALPFGFLKTFDKMSKIGIQLYTVRDDMARDAKGTLRRIAETGFAKVESAGYHEGRFYGMKPKALEAIGHLLSDLHHSPIRKAIPLSVKTRIGFDRNMIEEWSACLIQGRPEVISIHGRTLSQMYRGQSDWEAIALAANRIQPHGILVIGNGDIQTLGESAARIRESGVNGVLIGRGSLGNPWVFKGIQQIREMLQTGQSCIPPQHVPGLEEKFSIMIQHASLFERVHGPERFVRMRKHLGWYCSGFPYAAAMRAQLVRTHSTTDVIYLVNQYQARALDNQDMEIPDTITAS